MIFYFYKKNVGIQYPLIVILVKKSIDISN